MNNEIQVSFPKQGDLRVLVKSEAIQNDLKEKLGEERAATFINNVIEVMTQTPDLLKCTPQSVYNALMRAALINLNVGSVFGHAYIVRYKDTATLQVGAKGYLQFAIRSGEFKTIQIAKVYEGDTNEDIENRLYSFVKNPPHPNAMPIGYVAGFKTLSGYEDYYYMSIEEIVNHAAKFSKTAIDKSNGRLTGVWSEHFEAMAEKTVLKRLLTKKAPMSLEVKKLIDVENPLFQGNVYEHQKIKEAQDLTNSPERFKKLLIALQNGKYSFENALDSSLVLLSDNQRAIVEQMKQESINVV